jgi:hypothetical protein
MIRAKFVMMRTYFAEMRTAFEMSAGAENAFTGPGPKLRLRQ